MGHDIVPIYTDLRNRSKLSKNIANLDFDAAINFAGISSTNHDDLSEIYSVNTVGAMNFISAIHDSNNKSLKSMLLISSAHVYGNSQNLQYDESQITQPNNHYGASKLSMEFLAQVYVNKLPIIIARPFNYTGPGQATNFVIPKLIHHFKNKKKKVELGNIEIEREFNDIRFVCEAYLALLEFGIPGETYNICTGLTHSLKKIIHSIQDLSNHEINVVLNNDFLRSQEIHKLCGNPQKLNSILDKAGVTKLKYKLEDTLLYMLET